jgi:simple sugar transport system ATP-binding protein
VLFRSERVRAAVRRVITPFRQAIWQTRGGEGQVPDPQGGLLRDEEAILDHATNLIEEFDIRTPSPIIDGGNLSGGNQQKLIVAREFSRRPRLLIAAQPTRGIDVGSIEFIHRQIIEQRDENAAVLLVSAELDEIMALSDRIAVLYKGEIIDTLPAKGATREQLGLLMAGIKN